MMTRMKNICEYDRKVSFLLKKRLDEALYELVSCPDSPAQTVSSLTCSLREIKLDEPPVIWKQVVGQCREHPVCGLLHEDPLTERAFRKPRGYSGDAELLDIIYQRDWRPFFNRQVSSLGASIFEHTIVCKAPAAVRARRDFLAALIDETALRVRQPHILSVACGHLREAEYSSAFCGGRIGRYVGLDQDPLSIRAVTDALSAKGIEAVCGSIKHLWSGTLARQSFDLIYAAGLYDYLDDALAQRLTRRMFDMLKPGGRLLVANYLPDIADVGYMEAFMDWCLIYRDQPAMRRLACDIPQFDLSKLSVYNDDCDTVVYLIADKRSH